MDCFKANGTPSDSYARAEIRDDGRYVSTCDAGHTTVTILQQRHFEILFEIGVHAILDGYYRESVSSFASILERFYEWAIEVIVASVVPKELFDECWKVVSRQSERQFGAFIFLWSLQFGVMPKLLSRPMIELRNAVVHNGKIPTRDEALKFGQAVLEIIRPHKNELVKRHPAAVEKQTMQTIVQKAQIGAKSGEKPAQQSTMSIPTLISLVISPSEPERTLEEYLKIVKRY
jgi:polyhydroxyalkanoate synthesis regulator phasin